MSGLPERITDWHGTINCRLEIRGPRGINAMEATVPQPQNQWLHWFAIYPKARFLMVSL